MEKISEEKSRDNQLSALKIPKQRDSSCSSSSDEEGNNGEGFCEDLSSSDEEESFLTKFLSNTHNQIAFSIPNVEERGRQKNKIDPRLPEIDKTYSLLPDMATGWRPKILSESIPSPIPLYFDDKNLNSIISRVLNQNKYPMVYLHKQAKTSFDLHRIFSSSKDGSSNSSYSFRFSKILFDESILKQFRIQITDGINSTNSQKEIISRSFSGMNPEFVLSVQKKISTAASTASPTLQFDDSFEGGNLEAVIKLSEFEYDLYLRPDTNTKGKQQWFSFKATSVIKNQAVRFCLCNLSSSKTLYQRGLKPYILTKKDSEWQQSGDCVYYSKRKNIRYDLLINSNCTSRKSYYELTFDYTFSSESEQVWFCSEPSYSYSQLNNFLQSKELIDQMVQTHQVKQVKLCKSLGGLQVPQLNITDYSSVEIPLHQRPTIIALIEYLLSEDTYVAEMRKKVIIRVIPMLNVDGVIAGNSTTSFAGVDLGLQMSCAERDITPETYHLRRIVRKDNSNNKLLGFIELKVSQKRKNCFMTGPYFSKSELNYYRQRLLPFFLSQRSAIFRYKSCRFTNTSEKHETASSILHKQFGVLNALSLEISEGLKDPSKEFSKKPELLGMEDFRKFGRDFALALVDFSEECERLQVLRDNVDKLKQRLIEVENKGQLLRFMPHIMGRGKPILGKVPGDLSQTKNFSEKTKEEIYLDSIKTTFKGIKEKQFGKKKPENDSDKFSEDSAGSDNDIYYDDQKIQIVEGIRKCLISFKDQFIKTQQAQASSLAALPKQLVIVLSQPIENIDKSNKKKKSKKDLNSTKNLQIKLCKLFKSKYQFAEDVPLILLLEELLGRKDPKDAQKNATKAINQFIKKYEREEEAKTLDLLSKSNQQQIALPQIEQPQINIGTSVVIVPPVVNNNNLDILRQSTEIIEKTNLNLSEKPRLRSISQVGGEVNSQNNNNHIKGRTPLKLSVVSQKGYAAESAENNNKILNYSENSKIANFSNFLNQDNSNSIKKPNESASIKPDNSNNSSLNNRNSYLRNSCNESMLSQKSQQSCREEEQSSKQYIQQQKEVQQQSNNKTKLNKWEDENTNINNNKDNILSNNNFPPANRRPLTDKNYRESSHTPRVDSLKDHNKNDQPYSSKTSDVKKNIMGNDIKTENSIAGNQSKENYNGNYTGSPTNPFINQFSFLNNSNLHNINANLNKTTNNAIGNNINNEKSRRFSNISKESGNQDMLFQKAAEKRIRRGTLHPLRQYSLHQKDQLSQQNSINNNNENNNIVNKSRQHSVSSSLNQGTNQMSNINKSFEIENISVSLSNNQVNGFEQHYINPNNNILKQYQAFQVKSNRIKFNSTSNNNNNTINQDASVLLPLKL